MGGGNKIVNRITVKNLRGKMELTADLYCDYIPTSMVNITFIGKSGLVSGSTYVSQSKYEDVSTLLGLLLDKPFTAQWTPQEDDTYIYEVIIEQ